MSQTDPQRIYFIGIGGTGMATVAGLAQQAGFEVLGSDEAIYPPMSDVLDRLGIEVKTPYSPDNVADTAADLFIVANALSRGHGELEAAIESGTPYTSFPDFMGRFILAGKSPIVVAGTHGKTTTSSMMSYLLERLGEDPGYFIGGQPKDLKAGYKLGTGSCFVLEGDEYDTAFFDKNSKFLHYRPQFVIFNNLEFDHADIFNSLEDIKKQFRSLLELVEDKSHIIANIDDDGVRNFLYEEQILDQVTTVSSQGLVPNADVVVSEVRSEQGAWACTVNVKGETATLRTQMIGQYNIANLSGVVACAHKLMASSVIKSRQLSEICEILTDFRGVGRRLDLLKEKNGISIYEDFAHHPTAVRQVIEGFKKTHPEKRLVVAFEPRNATSRRDIFMEDYAKSFHDADSILIGKCPTDLRIAAEERMDTGTLASLIGAKAKAFDSNEELLSWLTDSMQSEDSIIFMSSGSFSGIQYEVCDKL